MSLDENVRKFNELLLNEISSRLDGSHSDYGVYEGDWPSDIFPAGNLKNCPKCSDDRHDLISDRESDSTDIPQYMRSNYTPCSMGLAIYIQEVSKETSILIEGGVSVFDNVFPKRKSLVDESERRYASKPPVDSVIAFPKRFARIKIRFESKVLISELEEGQFNNVPLGITERSEIDDIDLVLLHPKSDIPKEIPLDDFSNEEKYTTFRKRISGGTEPERAFEIQIRHKKLKSCHKLDIFLINRTNSRPDRKDWRYDPFFFSPELSVQIQHADLAEVDLPEVTERDYRYSTYMSATGRNCRARVVKSENRVVTETLPLYLQPHTRWTSRVSNDAFNYDQLAEGDPRPVLKLLAAEMRLYLGEWEKNARDYRGDTMSDRQDTISEQVIESRRDFEGEITRFERGIDALDNEELRLAFKLMNRSYSLRFGKIDPANKGWRSFQLAFIVSVLPDILARERPNSLSYTEKIPASVLWLPTGAGKTEAFTGVILTQAFFDRIRGKDGGTSAILKFPLRFLSMQQLDRATIAVAAANIVLDESSKRIDELRTKRGLPVRSYEKFSVGYFVGESATPNDPNKLADSGLSPIQEIKRGLKSAKRFKIIAKCPNCMIRESNPGIISLDGDESSGRIIHFCKKCGTEVPLYTTDHEIYTRIPTLIISTIDKWAAIGSRPQAQTIFGVVRSKCLVHGYSFMENRCMFDERCKSQNKIEGIYDGPPSLVVQDELHMLGESLGALSSQYETFLRNYAKLVNDVQGMNCRGEWKIIASTATIAGYDRHMKSMYLKNSELFPVKGPSARESFYFLQDYDKIQRIVMGFVPHNMTHPNAVIKVLQYFHAFVKRFETSPGRLAKDFPDIFTNLDSSDEKKLVRYIRTSLMYGIVKSETYQVLNSIDDQIDPYLKKVGIPTGIVGWADVTGDTTAIENIGLLERLQDPDPSRSPEFIVATSSISHGVDLAQLNFMVFRGQPRSTAEFIQAMSRIGRSYQGFVICIYNPNRERDASHYMLHNEFLELGNVLIAPPSIDRYSRQAIDLTAGGVILGLSFLGQKNKTLIMGKNFLAHLSTPANRNSLKERFVSSYLPDYAADSIPDAENLRFYVGNTFDSKIRAAQNDFDKGLSVYSSELLGCVTSLRQTDIERDLVIIDGQLIEEIRRLRKTGLEAAP